MKFFSKTDEPDFDPLELASAQDHPALAVMRGELEAAAAQRDKARLSLDALLSEPVDGVRWKNSWRGKRLRDAEQALWEAERDLSTIQERFSKGLVEIRAEIKERWLERARILFEDFRRKAEALEREHEQLKEISVIGERLFGLPYHISFKAFCQTNGGESAFSVWCKYTERELR